MLIFHANTFQTLIPFYNINTFHYSQNMNQFVLASLSLTACMQYPALVTYIPKLSLLLPSGHHPNKYMFVYYYLYIVMSPFH